MELQRLPQAEARRLLALAGVSLAARRHHDRPEEWISIEGQAISDEALAAAAHRILEAKRRAAGSQPVDLTHLVECGRAIADG
jgi:hypothetical protein